MAGLAEFCTHVACSLFWTEISIKISESSTVTDRAAYWVAPSNPSYLQPQKKQKQKTKKTKKKQNKTKKQKQKTKQKKKTREILHCIQEDQHLDKSKEKKENKC